MGFKIESVVFDGNIDVRRAGGRSAYWNDNFGKTSRRNEQSNVIVQNCNSCSFTGMVSVNAVAASGFIFSGADGLFDHTLFQGNGNGLNKAPNFGEWADGLTVVSGPRVRIQSSVFRDNSDINLIVAGAAGGQIVNNYIESNTNFAFAGLMLDNFDISANSDMQGINVEANTINCNLMCGIGLNIGPYIWYWLEFSNGTQNGGSTQLAMINGAGGNVRGNTILRARQGLGVYGAFGFSIYGNQIQESGGFSFNGRQLTSAFDMDDSSRFYGALDYARQGIPTNGVLINNLPINTANGVPTRDINAMMFATKP
ncbi:hypothetical protein [Oligoflexus sp.]|uniref:hypothetical protein n=1 Tax=Oligoflexus sp. TaxID=1971216 RepID=UPI002D76C7CB|nr:hypothetical protein [Oligoflexus sp.]